VVCSNLFEVKLGIWCGTDLRKRKEVRTCGLSFDTSVSLVELKFRIFLCDQEGGISV